jgi:hypothetical protein
VIANRWETAANTNPPGPIELEISSQLQVLGFPMPFTTCANCEKMRGQNHFAEPNWHALIFFHSILICRLTYEPLLSAFADVMSM